MSPELAIRYAHELENLKAEYDHGVERLREIRVRIRELCACLQKEFMPVVAPRVRPKRSRPVEDKLAISVGRAVVAGLKTGWDQTRIENEALARAAAVAGRCGQDTAASDFSQRVREIIRSALEKHSRVRGGVSSTAEA
jgi:hypothetical protein